MCENVCIEVKFPCRPLCYVRSELGNDFFSLIMYDIIPFCFKCTEYHVVISSTVPLLDLSCISWKNKNLLLDNG